MIFSWWTTCLPGARGWGSDFAEFHLHSRFQNSCDGLILFNACATDLVIATALIKSLSNNDLT
jgi:hypothetical protein